MHNFFYYNNHSKKHTFQWVQIGDVCKIFIKVNLIEKFDIPVISHVREDMAICPLNPLKGI